MHWLLSLIEFVSLAIEIVGVVVIVSGFFIATRRFLRHKNFYDSRYAYLEFRHGVGRSILLGLDFLIAGDLIKTVVVLSSGEGLITLAAVVVIRAFLGFTLHVEVEGHWPWQPPHAPRRRAQHVPAAGADTANGHELSSSDDGSSGAER